LIGKTDITSLLVTKQSINTRI